MRANGWKLNSAKLKDKVYYKFLNPAGKTVLLPLEQLTKRQDTFSVICFHINNEALFKGHDPLKT